MKNLKTTPVLTLIMAVLFSFAACKKDKNDGPGGGSSAYKFADKSYTISNAIEKHIEGDIFLEFDSTTPGDALQITFANVDAIPEGKITYNGDRNVGYNPQTNFWVGVIVLEGNSIQVNGGYVNVTKSDGNIKIEFHIETANGPITGEYNGTPTVTN